MTETPTETRADEIEIGSVHVEPADHMIDHERRWTVVDREIDPTTLQVVLWFERVGGDDPKTSRRVYGGGDMLAVATPPAVDPAKVAKARFEAVLADEFDRTGNVAEAIRSAREVAGYPAS